MVEVDRTLTPIFSERDDSRIEEKNFEQKLRKVTKGRRWHLAGRLFLMPFVYVYEVGQVRTRENAYKIWKLANLANFFSMIRWDFEDLSAPYEN